MGVVITKDPCAFKRRARGNGTKVVLVRRVIVGDGMGCCRAGVVA